MFLFLLEVVLLFLLIFSKCFRMSLILPNVSLGAFVGFVVCLRSSSLIFVLWFGFGVGLDVGLVGFLLDIFLFLADFFLGFFVGFLATLDVGLLDGLLVGGGVCVRVGDDEINWF